jgi:hypothetical protein
MSRHFLQSSPARLTVERRVPCPLRTVIRCSYDFGTFINSVPQVENNDKKT